MRLRTSLHTCLHTCTAINTYVFAAMSLLMFAWYKYACTHVHTQDALHVLESQAVNRIRIVVPASVAPTEVHISLHMSAHGSMLPMSVHMSRHMSMPL